MIKRLLPPLLAMLAGCQNYEFHEIQRQPVLVVTKSESFTADAGTAYIMIVQDISGSMCEPVAQGPTLNSMGCTTDTTQDKLSLVSQDMAVVLPALLDGGIDGGAIPPFYVGLTSFPVPGGVGCTPPTSSDVAVGLAASTVAQIVSQYAGFQPADGTPTAAALLQAAKDPSLLGAPQGSRRYILLITDGFPNCNGNNACVTNPSSDVWSDGQSHGCMDPKSENAVFNNSATNPNPQCQCSEATCQYNPATNAMDANIAALQCLDGVNTESALSQILDQGIKTYVVGVGGDFNNNYTVLDAMAAAGGGASTACRATDEPSLFGCIQGIIGSFVVSCEFTLSPPPADQRLIEVTIDGSPLSLGDAGTDFSYDAPSATVTLGSAVCAEAKSGTHSVQVVALANPDAG